MKTICKHCKAINPSESPKCHNCGGKIASGPSDATACYLIERGHHSRPGRWEVMGEFVAGSPWRDGRPVDDETMREEVKGYRRTWPAYLARVRCPNGEILSDNSRAQVDPDAIS
jgi:hypothetical protein